VYEETLLERPPSRERDSTLDGLKQAPVGSLRATDRTNLSVSEVVLVKWIVDGSEV